VHSLLLLTIEEKRKKVFSYEDGYICDSCFQFKYNISP
jgi:hypothetical protein